MKVKELAKALAQLVKQGDIKADDEVLLSSDEEGNSFRTITADSFGIEEANDVELNFGRGKRLEGKVLIIYPS